MGQREEMAAALCWAQQVNLLLSERGLSLLAVLIFVVLLDVGVKPRGVCGSRLGTATSPVAAQE